MFVEPFEFEPTLSFIALKDVSSEDADGIKSAIMKAFDDIGMPEVKYRMLFFASDSTSVNSGIKTGMVIPSFARMVLTGLCLSGVCLIN